jgi:hypothetical protein
METESKPRVEQVEATSESTETESKKDATKIFSPFLSFENNGPENAEALLHNKTDYDLSTSKKNMSNLPAKIEGKSDGQNSSNESKPQNSESPELDAFANIVQEIDSEIHDQPQSFAASLSPAVDHPVEDINLNYSSEILNETYESTEEIEEIPLGRVPSDDRTAGADEKGIIKRRKKKVKKQTDEKSAAHKKEAPVNQSNNSSNPVTRLKTAGNNTRKSLTAEELAALPLTLYHSELVENKYDRPVIVSMLVPERYIHHTNNKSPEGSNPPSPKSSSHLKRQTTMDPQYQHEVSMEDFAQVDGHPHPHAPPRSLETDQEEDNFSNHSNVEHNSSERPHSPSAIYQKLTPNKNMKYFVIKVNDLVSSREASYTVLLRDFGSLLHDLIKEYQTLDVTEFFQPFLLSWWKENLKKIVLIYDKPNGTLSLVIDKKLIKKIMRKKMEHYYWMKENLSNSYRQYEEKHQQKTLPALEKMTMSASMSYDESYNGEASHYEIRNEHCEDVPIDPNGESSQEDLVKMRKGVPVRKAVEFSAENVSNDSTSEKRKNTGTILKQSQSRSERILPTTNPENGELSTEELNNMSFDFQDHPPPANDQDETAEKPDAPSQQLKLNQTRNSGVSKSMPNFGSRSSDNLVHHDPAPGKSSKKNKSHEQQVTDLQTPDDDKNLPVEEEKPKPKKEKRASMKNYNRPTNPKTNELLMVAYGRPQDYQPDASVELLAILDEEPKSSSAGGKQKIRSSITRSSVTRSSAAIKTVNGEQQQDKSTVKASKKASLTTNEMPVKGEKEEKKKTKKNKRLSMEATEDTSVGIDTSEFVLSPYDAKTKRVSSPKQSSQSPDTRNSTKLPAITTSNTHSSQTTGQRSHSPKNIFRMSNPYSFALQQHSYENGPQTHSEPFHSTGELPTINHHSVVSSPDHNNHTNHSRPLSPISPAAAVAAADIAAKLYYDTNYNPDDHHSLLENSSLLDGTEDSFSNSQVSSFELNPQQQNSSNNVPFQKQNSHHSQQQHPHSSSFLFNRANTPFESEIHGLRGSAKLAADIIKKARKTVSSDIKFQVRKVSQTEQKLLQR